MTEADYEYLLHTLSEARSRASEIAAVVRSRVGAGHRLAELGGSAVSQIENLLREVRRAAADQAEPSSLGEALPAVAASTIWVDNTAGSPASSTRSPDVASEHWFPLFVNDLLEAFRASGGMSFETAERLLHARKEQFAKDLETARRMYETYPQLFKENDAGPRR
jgi:hypothetical protein